MTALNLSLEGVLTGAGMMDLAASPLQLAICRAACGLAVELDPELVERHFGCEELPPERPRRVVLICGVRGGKSTLGVAHAITACLAADLRRLKLHEVPRYAIVAPTVDAAEATFKLLVGYLQSSTVLSQFLAAEPTANTVIIKRPDGRCVEIVVVAAHRGGLSVRNRWLVGITLEEVASFGSEATGAAVNAEEILRAAETRLLDGCQAWLISSPFGPVGLLYEQWKQHFGKPSTVLVAHAPTRALNPSFPQERIDEIARESPDVAAREYNAEWIDADSAYLSAAVVDRATRDAPTVRLGAGGVAAMDPGTRGNSWTLAVGWAGYRGQGEERETHVTIAGVWSWTGSKKAPLSARETLKAIATVLNGYAITQVYSDGYSFDALHDHARAVGLSMLQHTGDRELPYARLKTMLGNSLIELPPDQVLRQDLLAIRQRATSGGVKVHLPKTADGRHCDFAPSVSLAALYAESRLINSVNFDPKYDRYLPRPRFAGGSSWFDADEDDDFNDYAPGIGRRSL